MIKLRILNTDANCDDIQGLGIRIRRNPDNDLWYWTHVYSNGEKGPLGGQGFTSKEIAIESVRTFKRDLSNDDMPIYVCVERL